MSEQHYEAPAKQDELLDETEDARWKRTLERHKELLTAVKDANRALHEFEINELELGNEEN